MEEVNQPNKYEHKRMSVQKTMQEIEAETSAWLNNNPKVQEYLSQFKSGDVTSFIKSYPALKASFMHYGATLGDLPDLMQEEYLETAAERMMDIQRKKLFDLICQWDAELVKVEDIDISEDFLKWDRDIENCPYLTPISPNEYALYLEFANTSNFKINANITLSNYENYRTEEWEEDEEPEEEEKLPLWFGFEDVHTGHSVYRKLPQIRTAKEQLYINLYHKANSEEMNRKFETGEVKKYVADERPELSIWHYRHIEQFIIHTENNKEVLQLFRKHYAYFPEQLIRDNEEDEQDGWLTEQVERIMHQLAGMKDKIAVEANEDWRVALIEGFAAYEKNKVLEALPYAYSDYLMKKQIGITSSKEQDNEYDHEEHIIAFARKQILRGRELNGEPRDFNF